MHTFYRQNNDGTNPQTPACGNNPVMWKHPISLGYIGDMNITSHWSRWPTCWIHSFAGFVGLIAPFSVPFTRRQLRAQRLWFWVLFRRRQTLIDGFPSIICWWFFGESSRKMTKQFMFGKLGKLQWDASLDCSCFLTMFLGPLKFGVVFQTCTCFVRFVVQTLLPYIPSNCLGTNMVYF